MVCDLEKIFEGCHSPVVVKTIKFITSNAHKFEEFMSRVEPDFPYIFEHYKMKYPEIQADSTFEIAVQSAATVMTYVNPPFLLEDSGLFVGSLGGFPGPYSSYIYQTIGWRGIISLMVDDDDRAARFYSVLVYVDEDRSINVFRGKVGGTIARDGRGEGGFGFDPIFVPEGYSKTFGEMGEEKNSISHRSNSVRKSLEYLRSKQTL